ncbi:MAG: hypothetical protein ACRD1H_10355 [Vicinamibacterales bacterium]
MNRRHFLGEIAFGSVILASHNRSPLLAAEPPGGLNIRFVGMMGFVERSDRSLMAALPGDPRMGHYAHASFLMARKGSPIAAALGLVPMRGVVAEAFDQELENGRPGEFVFRCLDHADMDIMSSDGRDAAVDNRATHLAQMNRIAPGKRVRGNLRQWSQATVSLQGGRLTNAAAHPDAGKVWTFGSYSQRLTDAVSYHSPTGRIRLGVGSEIRTFAASNREAAELWIVSAGAPRTEASDPRTLEHGAIVFEYLSDAAPITAYCAEAEGRAVSTELPCVTSSVASLAGGFAPAMPPWVELCFMAMFGLGR